MIILLADENIQGQIRRLVSRMQGAPWTEFWTDLHISCVSFADVGLHPGDTDAIVWHRCQERQAFLLTNNRNDDGPDSLENTIRTCSTSLSLPVFTIGDVDQTLIDRDYSNKVIWALLEYLVDIDNLLGTGRLYIP